MTRLIDADAIQYEEMDVPYGDGMYDVARIVYEGGIDAMPTVEAIPIAWLQAKADSWNAELKTACPEDAEIIRHIRQKYIGIIEQWRKEDGKAN